METELEKIQEAIKKDSIEASVLDNKVEFVHDDITYRVSKPTYKQKQEAYKFRVKKFNELMSDKSVKFEKDIVLMYKEKGIDLNELTTQTTQLETDKHNLQLKLGEALASKASVEDLEEYKKAIQDILDRQIGLMYEKLNFTQFSLESQLNNYMYTVFTMLITEKKDGEKWVRVWNTLDEFENSDEALINAIATYSTLILRNEI